MTDEQANSSGDGVRYFLVQFPQMAKAEGAAFAVVKNGRFSWNMLNRRDGGWSAAPELEKSFLFDGDVKLRPVDRAHFLDNVRNFGRPEEADGLDRHIETVEHSLRG